MKRPLTALLLGLTITTTIALGQECQSDIEMERAQMDIQDIREWIRTMAFVGIDDAGIARAERNAKAALEGISQTCRRKDFNEQECDLYTEEWQHQEETLADLVTTKDNKAGLVTQLLAHVDQNHMDLILPFVELQVLDNAKIRAREIRAEVEAVDSSSFERAPQVKRVWDSWSVTKKNRFTSKIKRKSSTLRRARQYLMVDEQTPEASTLLVEEFTP